MTKARLILFAIIFVVSMLLGIYLYSELRSQPVITPAPSIPNPTVKSTQKNYYILRVDDLNKASPNLISVWVALIFPADYSTLIFKSLYPPPLTRAEGSLSYPLRVGPDGHPTAEFWQVFNQIPIERNGFILVDHAGLYALARYITGSEKSFGGYPDDRALLAEAILTEEHLLWQDTCLSIQSKRGQRGPALEWSELIPTHFRTDINFAELIYLWDKFSNQSDTLHCEILITP